MKAANDLAHLTNFEPLRRQLLAAAKEFADAKPLSALLGAIVDDVHRAAAEPLEIFPVCHHSPAAALHMVRRLTRQAPRVIFMEMCEDMRPLLDKLRDCKLPVALQAFAGQTDSFPLNWTPLSVVAPTTEFSAEYQAIVYALENPGTELVFVDRSVDHVFQWMPQKEDELEKHLSKDAEQDETAPSEEEPPPPMHGAAIGVQMGTLEPTFERFHEFLLKTPRCATSPSGGISTSNRPSSAAITRPIAKCWSSSAVCCVGWAASRRITTRIGSANASCGRA